MMLEILRNKKIAILGFGKEGQSTTQFLLNKQIPVAAILDKEENPTNPVLVSKASAKYIGGEAYLDTLSEYDIIFRSPGFPRNHPKLAELKNQNSVYSHVKLFFDLCPCPVIGVTGTKGKSTTTSLIYEILKTAEKKVFLGGNIGTPPLDFLDQLDTESVVVLELSSFQTMDLHKSPHIGVILEVTNDHLDDGTFRPASHSSQQEYFEAKANMIAHQISDDFAILHPSLDELFKKSGQGNKIFFDENSVKDFERKLLGQHNLENIAAAMEAVHAIGVSENFIRKAIANFNAVPQRIQVIATKNGITYVNDSASTTPDSTIAAINAFKSEIILIIGGSDKGVEYKELGEEICVSGNVKAVVVIGQVASKILDQLKDYKGQILTGARNMAEILSQANSIAESGDTVLLSPAAASFDMFANSKDRGIQFDEAVRQI